MQFVQLTPNVAPEQPTHIFIFLIKVVVIHDIFGITNLLTNGQCLQGEEIDLRVRGTEKPTVSISTFKR